MLQTEPDTRAPRVGVQAGLTGIEPATSAVTDRHSNQLSYSPTNARAGIYACLRGNSMRQKFLHLNACFTFGMFVAY